jgi:Flp pilus assembly protein TadD
MSFRSKAHWTTILAIGLPLIISGCAQTERQNNATPSATAPAPAPAPSIPSNVNALTLAQNLEADGNYSNAAVMYQQAVANNPQDLQAVLGLGDSYLATGILDQAALAYAQALEIDPNSSRALRGLASARIMKGEPQFATAQLEKAIKIDPKDYKAMNTLGVALDMLSRHAEAQTTYRNVLKSDPKNQSAKNNLALSLALTGNTTESIKLLEEIGASTRSTAISKQNLALVYAAAGRTEDAMMLAQSGAAAGTVQQVAALYSASSQEDKRVLLRRAFGIEFKGTQFVAANQQIAVVSQVEEPSPYTEGVFNITTTPQGANPPSIISLKTNIPDSKTTTAATTAKPAAKGTDEAWAEDWNEELVDAADLAGLPSNQPTSSDAATDESLPPAPTAAVATTTDKKATPAAQTDDDAALLPMGSAGPVAETTENAKPEKPVQVAEANDHAAGAIAAPVTPAETAHGSSAASSTVPVTEKTKSADTAAAKEPAAVEPMVKKQEAAATPVASTAATPATAPAKDIQVAALPPADVAKPAISASKSESIGEPKKLTTESGTTITEQATNAGKIYTVQIAAFRKEDEAKASWQMLKTEQSDLAALPHNVEKADLGKDKGIYYRLQAGSFADIKDANSLCSSLQKRSIECMVVEAKQVSMNSTAASAPTVQ